MLTTVGADLALFVHTRIQRWCSYFCFNQQPQVPECEAAWRLSPRQGRTWTRALGSAAPEGCSAPSPRPLPGSGRGVWRKQSSVVGASVAGWHHVCGSRLFTLKLVSTSTQRGRESSREQ